MTNAEKFKQLFGLYATELWSKSEKDFLTWLNMEYVPDTNVGELIGIQDAIEEIARRDTTDGTVKVFSGQEVIEMLKDLPSVQPRKGKWIDFAMSIKGVPTECCGECGAWSYDMGKNFCTNCGSYNGGKDEVN